MDIRPLVYALLGLGTIFPAMSQVVDATPKFLAADVHTSPRRSYPFFFSVSLPQNRFLVRDATMVDLITNAWSLDPNTVQGGPGWLERDRFDILAKVPTDSTRTAQKLMMRALLADRFHLKLHEGTAPMPVFSLTAGNGKPKLKAAEGGDAACDYKPAPQTTGPVYLHISCRNLAMDEFAQRLHDMGGAYFPNPVVNSTGIEGLWDFDLRWTGRGNLEKQGTDGISIFDAVEKQLGLQVAPASAPRTVVLVDSVDRQPTANAPDLDKILPPQPPPQFEVATVKPSKPGTRQDVRISGGNVNFANVTMKYLIDLAWDLNQDDRENIVGAPKWLDETKFDLLAKVASDSSGHPVAGSNLPMDIYEVELMLRALLIERFRIKAHMGERTVDSYTLVAATPKLKQGDPAGRSICKEGPGPDGRDPRLQNAALNRIMSCRNVTAAEICEELQYLGGGYIFNPVVNATGLEGVWDFTLSFSSSDRLTRPAAGSEVENASVPNEALSLFEAVNRQLGLKLEKQRRPEPVLVIDHIEQKPAEN